MKLLLDQNLSPRLIHRLADLYPDSIHVQTVGLDHASDTLVWQYAQNNGYIIVTKDVDFSDRSVLYGFPPKVVWIRRGNCSTQQIELLLRDQYEAVKNLDVDTVVGLLTVF